MMKPMLTMKENESLDSIQMEWFKKKEVEELYDVKNDPHDINNVVNQKSKEVQLEEMRGILRNFLLENPDLGQIPEAELISIMWPGNIQPETEKPIFKNTQNTIEIIDNTPGASIVYMITENKDANLGLEGKWKLYTKPILLFDGEYLFARAERIGFKTSKPSILEIHK